MFKEKMVTTAIPERVYALCKIVEKGPISLSELKDKMEPEFLGNGSVYFNDYKNAAQELELISVSDDQIQLAVDPKVIKNISKLGKFSLLYIASRTTGSIISRIIYRGV